MIPENSQRSTAPPGIGKEGEKNPETASGQVGSTACCGFAATRSRKGNLSGAEAREENAEVLGNDIHLQLRKSLRGGGGRLQGLAEGARLEAGLG